MLCPQTFSIHILKSVENATLRKFSGTPKEMFFRSTNSKKVAIEPKDQGRKPGQKSEKFAKEHRI